MFKNPGLIPNYNKYKDKGIMFMSASSPKDVEAILDANTYEVLVSYFYIRKRMRKFSEEVIPRIKENDGLFMTDSGGFSYITGEEREEYFDTEFWLPYVEEYVQWLHDFKEHIFVAANLDLDKYVGRDVIEGWNEKYFKPLEKYMNVVYVVHRDFSGVYADPNGLKRLKQYMEEHDYVGVNQSMKGMTSQIYALAKAHKKLVHGFAWTSIPMLKSQPLFSCDSTTWLGGTKFGVTYHYDGKNFVALDRKYKYIRKFDKLFCKQHGIDYNELLADKENAVHQYNLIAWKGARQEYIRAANVKLWNKSVYHYERLCGRK